MLTVKILNDGTGTNKSANYKCKVLVNTTVIYETYISGHDRSKGWPALLQMLVDKANQANKERKNDNGI